ncbi:angiotensin-converting enzyme-like [Cylas formicarius]|uniref:angiotensin-converting enzyme-like n=1 Tax=Cylas formicarius TaxID=197179 RepID=UPI002958ACFE|nr:angiotensin-converting enzyme-like [Cylas formicarius]
MGRTFPAKVKPSYLVFELLRLQSSFQISNMLVFYLLPATIFFSVVHAQNSNIDEEEAKAREFLVQLNEQTEKDQNRAALASWAYSSNITDENLNNELAVSAEVAKNKKESWEKLIQYDWLNFTDYDLKRQFRKYSVLGVSALSEDKFTRRNEIIGDMEAIYAKAKICPLGESDIEKCTLALEPELTNILAISRDAEELKHVWLEWRNAVGPKCRDLYEEYVDLSNEAAVLNNFKDTSDYWLEDYEDDSFKQQVQDLWEQLRPLYLELHAYVRFNLRKLYGEVVSENGPIPAHLLGNMWAQTWENIADTMLPYPNVNDVDITAELVNQNYTAIKIFETAESFFKSINLTEMPASFWTNSILERPSDRDLVCHASAWDFSDGGDFRIKQCTEITSAHFTTAHHEMGHIEYYLQYKDQPITYRGGANDGFHEAVGDLIALSVQSSKHLRKIGLLPSGTDDPNQVLNSLFKIGMSKIAFLPFGYLMDLWRWDVFSGKTQPENYNCRWWELREEYQGIEPPQTRSEDDFDPAAKYHIVADVPYLRYFISFVIQFQFHRALCEKAGEYEPNNAEKPLHECDIYENTNAGNVLKQMLAMGSSRPWPDAMEVITGQRKMDASGILDYFKPLQDWLATENAKNNVTTGWESSKMGQYMTQTRFAFSDMLGYVCVFVALFCAICAKDSRIEEEELEARNFLLLLNEQTEKDDNRLALASWSYASNLTDENLKNQLAVAADVAKKEKDAWQKVIQYDWTRFSDPIMRRQLLKYSVLGVSALPEDKFKRLNQIISDMEAIYSKAKICPRGVQDQKECKLGLEPELTTILENSRDPEELKHVWLEWRRAVGPKCRTLYKEYVALSNEAARLNNFTDTSHYWLHDYEDPNFRQQVQELWEQMRPLYLQIHAYVRFKLRQKYGDIVTENGPIPAHLLGNMWAQSWSNVAELMLPHPDVKDEDLTQELVNQNYTAIKIFQTAENFFRSINLTEMPPTFWENSIFEKPDDREIVCHASAWDFYDKKDFRIKQCTKITGEHFITVHHEMGHIEYFIQYKDQPIKFRAGANDGFHEAIGDLISLSVQSTKHLRKIGLLHTEKDDPKQVLNNLFRTGLSKITFLPFGYLMDLWRWDVFSGKTKSDDYNCKWWELREKYQGIEPPQDRSEDDFDPAAKYHIIADVPYLRYFISFVIQFQFHRALCEKAGQYEKNNPETPLHECDIYGNENAGNALKQMLSMGSSKPWPDAMEVITGQRSMDASGLLEYFKPLQEWLEEENARNNVTVGWEPSKRVCVRTRQELEAKKDENV